MTDRPEGTVGEHDKASGVEPTGRAGPRPARSTSRHYHRAQKDRGAETRLRLLDAALDIFGKYGFDGATTRQIARGADANLAAIVYHFGSKEALHNAVAEHVAARINSSIGPALVAARDPVATATPDAARAAYYHLIESYIDIIVGNADAERWARFIVREQMQPTTAFEIIYRIMGGAMETGTRLVATALGQPQSEDLQLRVVTLFGQVLIFRVAQALVLRRLGWSGIGPKERAAIKRVVIGHIDAIFDREAAT